MPFLYRGVNPDIFRTTCGKLIPKVNGEKFERYVYYGEEVYYGDGSVYGKSSQNAVIMHQRDSSKYRTSGISTTPFFENAVKYATNNGKYKSGYVFKIDTTNLSKYQVETFYVDEHATKPAIPEDKEVILVAHDFGQLPDEIIAEIIEV